MGAQASQGKGPLPTLTPQSSIRHVRPGVLPRGGSVCQVWQCGGRASWWATPQAIFKESRRTRLQGRGREGSWAGSRQEAQGTGPIVQLEQSWGLGTLQGPATSCKPGPALWRVWASASSPISTIPGASCGGWTSPPGKGSDVKRREGRMSQKGREGGQEGGDKHAESTGVVLPLLARFQPAQRPLLGTRASSLSFLAQRRLGSGHCQPLRPALPQTLPQHSFSGALRP